MFYSKTAALAQHVGEITKILQEIYRDTDKKISDIELRNRAQCLILLGYTLRRRKTNKPFVPAEKSEWIQLYNNGACAMKDYCDMGMQVYVAKKCEDVKCLIVPGCAGGGGSGGGGGSKSGGSSSRGRGSDFLEGIKIKYENALLLINKYVNINMQKVFEYLYNEYNYLINNRTKIDSEWEAMLLHFNLNYELILDIANILDFDNVDELAKYFANLNSQTTNFCTNELNKSKALLDLKIKMGTNLVYAEYLLNEFMLNSVEFNRIYSTAAAAPDKLKLLKQIAIYLIRFKTEVEIKIKINDRESS